MTLVTRKAFADMCHGDEKKLNVHIGRGKLSVYPGNKKLLDPENPINAAYLLREKGEIATETPAKPLVKDIKKLKNELLKRDEPAPEKPKKALEPREIQQKVARQTAVDMKRVQMDQRKEELQVRNLELRQQQLEIQLQKTSGKLLPIDLAEGVITRHGVTFLKEFEKGFMRIAEIFVAKTGSDPAMRAELIAEGKTELGRCVRESGEKAEKEIESLISEYSETLARGQKKA